MLCILNSVGAGYILGYMHHVHLTLLKNFEHWKSVIYISHSKRT